MSSISDLIFNGENHYISSCYGKRAEIRTHAGITSTIHRGVDYGTNGKKLVQYAVADGVVLSCGNAADGANYVWVEYPTLGVKMLHCHLDTISVVGGQAITKGTKLATTGMTGKATGIHLHLGLQKIDTNIFIDPEMWSKNVYDKMDIPKDVEGPATDESLTGDYEVIADLTKARKKAGTKYAYLRFNELTEDTQVQIKALNDDKEADGLVKGCTFTVSEVNKDWGKTSFGWINLKDCKKTK